MRGASRSDDTGASLLLVLIFMLFISVLALGVLSYSQASFTAHQAVRDVRQDNYAADAALELGIHEVVHDVSGLLGTPGVPCPQLTLGGADQLPTATVTCAANGSAGGPVGSRALNAILTLSTSATSLQLQGNHSLGVTGNVYSHGDIVTGQPFNTLDVAGTVHALGDGECSSPKVTATFGKACGATATSYGADPAWASRAGTLFAAGGAALTNPAPVCSVLGGHKLATFTPGKYTTSPTGLLGGPGCANRDTLLLLPGVYYLHGITFDTGGYDVVAGTPGPWLAGSTAPPVDGTACVESAPGVQLLLGGSAAVRVPNQETAITLCAGPASTTEPAIAIYGVRASGNGVTAHAAATGLTTSNRPSVFVFGTVYMPAARASIVLHNKAQTYFRGGFAVSALTTDVSASSKQIDSPIAVSPCSEDDPCRSDRQVVFTASIDGKPWIRSVVSFDDAGGADPARSHTVDSWSVQR